MLVVITNGCLQLWGDVVTRIQSVGVQAAALIDAVELRFCFACGKQGVGIECPGIAYRFCIDSSLLKKDRAFVCD